jgi:hypothetical protein
MIGIPACIGQEFDLNFLQRFTCKKTVSLILLFLHPICSIIHNDFHFNQANSKKTGFHVTYKTEQDRDLIEL